jgi:hypothetical protein
MIATEKRISLFSVALSPIRKEFKITMRMGQVIARPHVTGYVIVRAQLHVHCAIYIDSFNSTEVNRQKIEICKQNSMSCLRREYC